jgi:hypothetical protein
LIFYTRPWYDVVAACVSSLGSYGLIQRFHASQPNNNIKN